MSQSTTPRQDYLRVTRDFVTSLQTHLREFEDHPDILNADLLMAAYKFQSALIQQHFNVLSYMYERDILSPEKEQKTSVESSIIISGN